MAATVDSKEMEQLLVAFDNYVKKATGQKSYLKNKLDSIFEPLKESGEVLSKNIKNIKFNEFEKSLKGYTKDFNKLFQTIEKSLKKNFEIINKNLFPKPIFKPMVNPYTKIRMDLEKRMELTKQDETSKNKKQKTKTDLILGRLHAINDNLIKIRKNFDKSLKGYTKDFNKLFQTIEKSLKKNFEIINKNLFPKPIFKPMVNPYTKIRMDLEKRMELTKQDETSKNKKQKTKTDLILGRLHAINDNLIKIRKNFDKSDSDGAIVGKNVGSNQPEVEQQKTIKKEVQKVNNIKADHDDDQTNALLGGGGMFNSGASKGILSTLWGIGKFALFSGGLLVGIPFLIKGIEVAIHAFKNFDASAGKNKFIANIFFRIRDVLGSMPKLFHFLKTFFSGGEEAVKLGGLLKPSFFGNLANIGKVIFKGGFLKVLGRIPFLGTVLSVGFAYKRFKKGDWVGGTLDILSAIANLFPGVGSVVALAIDGISMIRDAALGGSDNASKMGLKEQGSKMWDYVKTTLWPNIKKFFVEKIWGNITKGFESFTNWLGETEVGKNIKSWLKENVYPKVIPFLSFWNDTKQKISDYWQDVKDFFGGVGAMVSTAYQEVKSVFDDFYNQGKTLFDSFYNDVVQPTQNFFKPMTDKLKEWGGTIADWSFNLAKDLYDKAKELFKGIKDTIFEKVAYGFNKAKDFVAQPFKNVTEVGRMAREAESFEKSMIEKEKKRLEELKKIQTESSKELKEMKDAVEKGDTSKIPTLKDGKKESEISDQLSQLNRNVESLQKATLMSGVMNADVTAKVGVANINANNRPGPTTQIFGGGAPDIDRLRLSGNRTINMPVGIQ